MVKEIEFMIGISFFVFIIDINADPIDESRKWGNVTEKIHNR